VTRRKPSNAFEAMLKKWQRGDEMSWGDLFAAWLQVPTAPRSRDMVRRLIRRIKWIA
jgi:hypothetical protein